MPVIINGKTYPLLTEKGQRGLTAGEQRLIEVEFRKPFEKLFASTDLTDKQYKSLPEEKRDMVDVEKRLAFLVTVWIARRRAGEKLSFDEAVDVELEHLTTEDEKTDAAKEGEGDASDFTETPPAESQVE